MFFLLGANTLLSGRSSSCLCSRPPTSFQVTTARFPSIGSPEKPSSNDWKGKIIFVVAALLVGSCRTITSEIAPWLSFRITARSNITCGARHPVVASIKLQTISLRDMQAIDSQYSFSNQIIINNLKPSTQQRLPSSLLYSGTPQPGVVWHATREDKQNNTHTNLITSP